MNDSEQDDGSLIPEADIQFASFGSRFGASLIDGLIISAVILPVTYFNVISWKIPYLFILTSLLEIVYKPFLEYRFGATLGKMAVGIQVLGYQFRNVSLDEEMKRVSFYMVPSIFQFLMTVHFYFSPVFKSTVNYNDFNQVIISSNPAMLLLGAIVFFLGVADCITFFMNGQRRALHDLYAGTYVVEKY
jgi:uncharacterized RDD family membrane protein YckC